MEELLEEVKDTVENRPTTQIKKRCYGINLNRIVRRRKIT